MASAGEANDAEEDPCRVADGELVGALRDAAELLAMCHRALDDVALAIALLVKAAPAHRALGRPGGAARP